ncbi:hypothetical protein BFW38_08205 [Terasakiispira papahanaumokuakeensis]|uniref:Uncharacterized protein n=1 Tax=Terasakiispira papahanaumokuakeensis TaxID=197479 RepID=A0A1E2V9D3_9GAMM|nr:hypothetical protein BFW38_08205 [Terasakiispira papahanaumokuakeensis]
MAYGVRFLFFGYERLNWATLKLSYLERNRVEQQAQTWPMLPWSSFAGSFMTMPVRVTRVVQWLALQLLALQSLALQSLALQSLALLSVAIIQP